MAFPELTADSIRNAIQSVADEFGVDIIDVELNRRADQWTVIVTVDADEVPDIDELSDLSETISEVLDESHILDDHPYVLEVTTPGVDSPLTHPRQWIRNRSRLVKVNIADQELMGRIGPYERNADQEEDVVVLIVPPQRMKGQPISAKSLAIYKIRPSVINSAIVQVEFKTPRGADVDVAQDDEIGQKAQWFPNEDA